MPRSVAGGMTGSPDFRVFVGFIFEPSIGDRDGDGIKDDVDRCPDEPEDFDDFEDEDGCPDPDNDKDGILDRDDQCPNEPGPVENHGCPLSDRDKDGILDKDDACPDVPGPVENQGCPWPDRDKDGIFDKDDECPDIPGPKENGGCPFLDSDGDGLLDKDDECPHEYGPEGEPRLSAAEHDAHPQGPHQAMNPIFFETAKAIIKPMSYPTLDERGRHAEGEPAALGHRDPGARRRARRRRLQHAADRGSRGGGEDLPRSARASPPIGCCRTATARPSRCATRTTRRCWSQNRRVEFVILRRSDGGVL